MTITDRRREKDLSLGECARSASLTPRQLSDIERARGLATDEQCAALAVILDWTPEQVRAACPTVEEIADANDKMAAFLDALGALKKDAKEHSFGKGNAGRGYIVCPSCKTGVIKYSVAGVNGHMWASCSTKGCIAFME